MPSRLQKLWSQKKFATIMGLGQFADPRFIEMVGRTGGWDGVWVDQEHVGHSIEKIEHCVRAAKLHGMDCFVRVAPTDYATVMRPLEAGAHGIMAAQIRSVEQAAQVIEWGRFYPEGMRGINGSGADNAFGAIPMADYLKTANQETYVIIQIEHIAAAEVVEKIAALKHLGGLFIGPADLSQSMGLPAGLDHPDVVKVIERVAKAARANSVPWSVLPKDMALAKRCIEWGCAMMSLGHDVVAIHRGLNALKAEWESLRS